METLLALLLALAVLGRRDRQPPDRGPQEV